MVKGFLDFIKRGNVVDLAVAVVIGAAFTLVVQALLAGIITPLIAAVFGEPNLSNVGTFTINDAAFSIGLVLDAVLNFIVIAAVIYFLVIVPLNALNERRRRGEVDPADTAAPTDEAILLREIRDLLRTRDQPVPFACDRIGQRLAWANAPSRGLEQRRTRSAAGVPPAELRRRCQLQERAGRRVGDGCAHRRRHRRLYVNAQRPPVQWTSGGRRRAQGWSIAGISGRARRLIRPAHFGLADHFWERTV